VNREEAESATELTALDPAGAPGGAVRLGPDALGVQGNTVRRNIRSFDDAYVFWRFYYYKEWLMFDLDGDSISLTNVCRTLIRLRRLGYSLRRVCVCLVGVGVGILRIWRI
jgi:hypothetical protein